MTNDDMDRVVPLGQLDDFRVAEGDPDVRGWEVLASDGRKVGEVDELLVDTGAMKVRYLDVDVDGGAIGGGHDRHVLIPIGYARLEAERDCVMLDGMSSAELVALPAYDQGPLTRDFESSLRDRFPRRGATSAGMAGAGMVDSAGLDDTPGTGTGMTGVGGTRSDTGVRVGDDTTPGAGIPDGAGMRAAGYDLEPGTNSPLRAGGADLHATASPRSAAEADSGVRDGGGRSRQEWTSGGMSAGSASSDGYLGGGAGDRMSAGGQGPVGGTGTDGTPRGDASHRTGMADSDSQHDADEDFYASDAFDEGRFYGARRRGGMPDAGTLPGSPGSAPEGMRAGPGGLTHPTRDEPGLGTGDTGTSREDTHRLAQDARERMREDHQNRDVGGGGGL